MNTENIREELSEMVYDLSLTIGEVDKPAVVRLAAAEKARDILQDLSAMEKGAGMPVAYYDAAARAALLAKRHGINDKDEE